MKVDHATKLVVLVSMTIALVIEAVLMSREWPQILPLTIAALAISAVASLRVADLTAAFVLMFAYTFPAIVVAFRGRFEFGYMTIWVAALLGAMLPGGRSGWALPVRWRAPLVLWALTVALVWPVIVLREIDFAPMTLDIPQLSVTGLPGVPPRYAILWILNVTLVLGAGILWFDWLHAHFDGAERRFRIVIVGALAVSWLTTTSVAIYQLLFDVTFLNNGLFGFLQRASGMMLDANPFGVIAALGIPVVAAAALLTAWTGRTATVLAVIGVGWAALWASGSRTAFASGIIGTAFVLYYWGDSVVRRNGVTRRVIVGGAIIVLAAILAPILLQRLPVVGAWRRLAESLPRLSPAELWNRDGYGLAATRMIGDFPGFGVGVGAFHYLVLDYSRAAGVSIPFDNAQNWYRHQLAEFGIVGSVGWILWTLTFGWFVVTTRVKGPTRWAAGAIRGALAAIAIVSLLGMPTQNLAVTVTFWTLAFWYALLAAGQPGDPAARSEPSAAVWMAILLIAAISVAGTAYSARHDLRVPMRAARFGWPYSYGFSDPETSPGGRFQWAAQRAVAVIDAPKPLMKLTVSVDRMNVARQPVKVEVWCDGKDVLETTLTGVEPVTEYVPIADGRRRIVLETRVDHTVRPTDFGMLDPRELGVMVQWEFVDVR